MNDGVQEDRDEAYSRLYYKAFEKAFVCKLPITICKINGWNSPTSKQLAIVCGAMAYVLWMILLCVYINYEALLAALGIKPKIAEDMNIGVKASIVWVKLLIDFGSAMGSVYSEIEDKKEQNRRYEEQRQHNEEQKASMGILVEYARNGHPKDQTIINIIQQFDAQSKLPGSANNQFNERQAKQFEDDQHAAYERMRAKATENTRLLDQYS